MEFILCTGSCVSITTNKLRFHCSVLDTSLAGFENDRSNLLFHLCHLIGCHCQGGSSFSKRTAKLMQFIFKTGKYRTV